MSEPDIVGFYKAFLEARKSGTAIASAAIRGGRLEPEDEPPAILLQPAGWVRDLILSPARMGVTTYAATEREAFEMWQTISSLSHDCGRVEITVDGNRIAIGNAQDETGPSERDDPTVKWPAYYGVIDLYMAATTLTAEGS